MLIGSPAPPRHGMLTAFARPAARHAPPVRAVPRQETTRLGGGHCPASPAPQARSPRRPRARAPRRRPRPAATSVRAHGRAAARPPRRRPRPRARLARRSAGRRSRPGQRARPRVSPAGGQAACAAAARSRASPRCVDGCGVSASDHLFPFAGPCQRSMPLPGSPAQGQMRKQAGALECASPAQHGQHARLNRSAGRACRARPPMRARHRLGDGLHPGYG